MTSTRPHPDQLPLNFGSQAELDRHIEARVAKRCQQESVRWRFQLITVETVMMSALVAIAGLLLHQPTLLVVRATLLIGASCFATGILLLGLSAGTTHLLMRFRRRRAS